MKRIKTNIVFNGKEYLTENGVPTEIAELNGGSALLQEVEDLRNNKQDKLAAGTNIEITDNTINAEVPEVLNERSTSQTNTYSAKYVNDNFVPISFTSKLYLKKTTNTTATIEDTIPTVSASNYMETTTINTAFDWSSPMLVLTRTLENQIELNSTNSFSIDFWFKTNRQVTLTFGAKIKVSTDNGSTWTYISNNQDFGAKTYINGLSNDDIVVYCDALATPTTYPIGTLLAIEVFTKQGASTSLTMQYYCGVTENSADIYSFVEFNFSNVNINTNQIEDGAITENKLDENLQAKVNFKELFVCTYNSTTYTSIMSAINDGKLPIVLYSGQCYVMCSYNSSQISFSIFNGQLHICSVSSSNTWSATTAFTPESVSNKVSSITSGAPASYYPTVGAVFNFGSRFEQVFRYSSLPPASNSLLNKIYQYIGTTNANYTNGYFYQCVFEIGVGYYWKQLNVQPASSGVSSIGGKTGAITLGTGLSIDNNNVLSASGGGGGGSLYRHNIVINDNDYSNETIVINAITNFSTEINSISLLEMLNGFNPYISVQYLDSDRMKAFGTSNKIFYEGDEYQLFLGDDFILFLDSQGVPTIEVTSILTDFTVSNYDIIDDVTEL